VKRFIIPIGFLVLAVLLALGLTMDPKEIPSPFIDKPAPAFSLPRLHQPEQTISPADLKGQVWVLNVWASWCVSCRAEHEIIGKLAATGEAPVVGLNYKDEPAEARTWLRRLGDPYFTSAMDRSGDVGIDWGVYGVPETFVIDKAGIVRYKHIGPVTEQSLAQKVLPCIKALKSGVQQCEA
jgi:cytochrome c biogenesis protein CcmG/thiol:disulfide interchange protein DsbE